MLLVQDNTILKMDSHQERLGRVSELKNARLAELQNPLHLSPDQANILAEIILSMGHLSVSDPQSEKEKEVQVNRSQDPDNTMMREHKALERMHLKFQ
jgi:hypothetical protein